MKTILNALLSLFGGSHEDTLDMTDERRGMMIKRDTTGRLDA